VTDPERMAELQYEAGMYQSLYENAVAENTRLRKVIREIVVAYEDPNDIDAEEKMVELARDALRNATGRPLSPAERTEGK
jgi:hypothetical protein